MGRTGRTCRISGPACSVVLHHAGHIRVSSPDTLEHLALVAPPPPPKLISDITMASVNSASESGPSLPFVQDQAIPFSHLDSLKFKSAQLVESIQQLIWTIEYGNLPTMPSWPDILAKYSVLISQTHSFSAALLAVPGGSGPGHSGLEHFALHPREHITEGQLDWYLSNLLRTTNSLTVHTDENAAIRCLAEHMNTGQGVLDLHPNPDTVITECAEIRDEHDRLVDRAVRAVGMLRDNTDWKTRVEVEEEEPEDLNWPVRTQEEVQEMDGPSSSSEADDEEVLGDLGTGIHTPEDDGDVAMNES
jgi:hypothetical protein